MSIRWVSFDCYGTLIDWDGGLRSAFAALWPDADPDALLAVYHEVEPQVQTGSNAPYRDVLATCLRRVAGTAGLSVPAGREDELAALLPSWPPFAEVPSTLQTLRGRGVRLAVLSNTDPDLLEASVRAIGVGVDERITAADAGGYKPAHGHWRRFFERSAATPAEHVHVAASLFHDVAPCAELGLRCIWINRLGETSEVPRTSELPDLRDLAAAIDALG